MIFSDLDPDPDPDLTFLVFPESDTTLNTGQVTKKVKKLNLSTYINRIQLQ